MSTEISAAPESPDPAAGPRAKILPQQLLLRRPMPELVPARMINEVLYCERLLYLEWVHGEFADNYFTVDGRATHRRADSGGAPLRQPPQDGEGEQAPPGEGPGEGGAPLRQPPQDEDGEQSPLGKSAGGDVEPEMRIARSVWLSSETLGITAKIDVVEDDATAAAVIPIEYKRGKRPPVQEGAYLPERAQLCAHVLLLREHGYSCNEAAIYFAGDRRRTPIAIDDQLIETTRQAAARAREVAAGLLPPPLIDSPKCNGCSLIGICLPDEIRYLQAPKQPSPGDDNAAEVAGGVGEMPAGEPAGSVRRLHPARDDKVPLYVQEQGARIGLAGERLRVRARDGSSVEARIANTSQVSLFGNVQISSQALRALMQRGIAVCFLSYGGWYAGRAMGADSNNVDLRLAQYRAATSEGICLKLARSIVAAKILNCRTMLRRNHREKPAVALSELKQLARKAGQAKALETLLGIEGTAARVYFAHLTGMLAPDAAVRETFQLDGRNRRPPRDPVNALLSFCYSLLAKDLVIAVVATGLDPLLGFYHQPRFGRPALALDLMEEFRPLVADSTVIAAVNNNVVRPNDFIRSATGVALTQSARRRLIRAYERRIEQLVTHPVFGYRISYRRVFEIQARLLGRMLLGELQTYPSFRTR